MNEKLEEIDFGTPQDIEDCRAAGMQVAGYAECLRGGPNLCKYAVPFGYCFLCHHPQVGEIVKQTDQAKG
jgi:hypothetical protein